jgi:FkbM family methyltransferase
MISKEEKQAVIDLFPFMGENPVVFDVGSNKGHWSDIILEEYKEGKCSLHLFEPNKKLISFTEIKYEYEQNIFFHNIGLLNENGQKEFYLFENFNNEISSFYNGKNKWDGLPVKKDNVDIRKGDFVCEKLKIEKIDYLKIDCEGSDLEALEGFSEMMQRNKIRIIQIEYSEHWQRAEYSFSNLKDIADKYEYKIYKYVEGNFYEVKNFIEDYAAENYYITKEEIHNYSIGWNSEFILNTIELPKFDFCLEVGAFEGLTTKYMAQNMLNEGGRVAVVDPLLEYYIEGDTEHPFFRGQYPRFKRNTRGLPVELFRGKSESELPKMHALRYDFIYLDGDHRKDAVYFDLVWCFAICKIEGYILIDDYTWRTETTEGIDLFLNEFSGSLEIIRKDYQVLIRKVANQYNELTYEYYK